MLRPSITVKGKYNKTFTFTFDGDLKYVDLWRRHGLEIDLVYNSWPEWLPNWAVPVWIKIEDLLNWNE